MRKLYDALVTMNNNEATAMYELLTTINTEYVERKAPLGTAYRMTLSVDGVKVTIDGVLGVDDAEFTLHNGNYEEYLGEGPVDYLALQEVINLLTDF